MVLRWQNRLRGRETTVFFHNGRTRVLGAEAARKLDTVHRPHFMEVGGLEQEKAEGRGVKAQESWIWVMAPPYPVFTSLRWK